MSSKAIAIVSVSVLVIVCFWFFYWNAPIAKDNLEFQVVESKFPLVNKTASTLDSDIVENQSHKPIESHILGHEDLPTKLPIVADKKDFVDLEDAWCIPSDDLRIEDQDFVAALQNDWMEYSGVAYIKQNDAVYDDDQNHPNNVFVAPYQEMPIEEIKDLTLLGDKWAMIAFLQKSTMDYRDEQYAAAMNLLAIGASYHAIEYLIISELASAKTSFRRTKTLDKSREHMINAVAYTIYGLNELNISALTAYAGNISQDELFQGVLNPSLTLADAQGDISIRYETLLRDIKEARQAQGISPQDPPEEVKKLFARDIASFKFRRKEAMEQLYTALAPSHLSTDNTECVDRHINNLRIIKEQMASLK
ncbi:hypothetical protein [Agaribacter marinus]|uniref:Uncharacterized protein n=1 Tax=Agaribacter marinus TaxID=1431249 RepID=A0AA37WJZ7_9ALTE|nr:hypothetical protein [Agaribacter marinus]GLR70789.1 hypothetical protein GCM10007852_16970 [Agaribacter marinus]